MESIGEKKTAIFLIIHDEKTTYHSLLTIFLKQCYEVLIDVAQKGGGNLETNTVKRLVYEPNSLPNDRYPQSVRKINNLNPSDRGLHPTQKPIELLEYFINTYSKRGDTVLDFTMGSGSTGVACLQTNRNFIGIELEPKYYEIAKERCSNYQSKLW